MSFVQSFSWIICILVIIILAIIGYFVDNEESKKKNNSVDVDNQNNNVSSSPEVIQEPLPNVYDDFIENNHKGNSYEDNVLPSSFKAIEDVNMSLADLENKNYNDLVKNRESLYDLDDINYSDDVSDFEHAYDLEISNGENDMNDLARDMFSNNSLESSFTSESENIVSSGVLEQSDVSVNTDENLDDDIFIPISSEKSDVISGTLGETVNDSDSSSADSGNPFDFDNGSDVVPELSDDYSNYVSDSNNDNNQGDGSSSLNLFNDSLDDDIWKF